MPSFEKAPQVQPMAETLMLEYHKPLIDSGVRLSFMFAWPCLDAEGNPIEDALTKAGMKCLGLTRKNATRQRKEGLADATITLDGPYWDSAETPERRSLLDHQLEHVSVVLDGTDTEGKPIFKKDNAGRPIIKLRKHDVEVGWFKSVAQRHAAHSQERIQASQIVELAGQFFFPQFVKSNGRISNLEVSQSVKNL